MRTTLWYSSLPNRARPLPSIFCTGGHDRPTPYAAVHRCSRNPAPSRSVRNCSSPLLRLPVVFGNTFRIPMQACAQLRGRLPLPALVPQHELKYRMQLARLPQLASPSSHDPEKSSHSAFAIMSWISDNRPSKNKSDSRCRLRGASYSPNRPRTSADNTRLLFFPAPHPPPHVPLSTRRLSNSEGAAGGSTPTPRPSPASPVRSTQFRTRHLLQHPQIIHPVGRHVMRAHCLRMPKYP